MGKKIITTLLLVFCLNLGAQESLPFYKHYLIGDSYLINPSYAGADPEVLNVTATYANQWADLPDSPSTQTLSAHATVADRLAFGFYIFNDRNGLTSMRGVNISAAYHIPIRSREREWGEGEDVFSFGLSYNGFQQKLDLDRVIANNPNDPTLVDPNHFLNYFNVGISFRYANAFGGISVLDIPLISHEGIANGVEPLPTWYNFTLGYNVWLFDGVLTLYPSAIMYLNANSARKFDLNLMSHISFGNNHQGVDLGVSYRQDTDKNGSQGLSVSPIMKLKIGGLKLGMSYDIGLSDIAKEAGNGFMFSLGYNFKNPFNPYYQ
ncbi:MAG: PorP/SprF family type IX secretion system membrane protein [Flavobacteriaceae bacterium]|jgi:type IX secretion system PorP/SprF family membrane protein|nr:PorP/SprF family type IX secretion system membrane protein [Weeksellaceae bacterium]MDY0090898.1 PorP/SprF family type IX secretion system membrane protein [Flavobacteriaceae bacterium]